MISLAPLLVTLKVVVLSVFFALALGILFVWITHGKKTILSSILEFLVFIPLFLPPTVLGFYILIIMSKTGFMSRLYSLLFSRSFIFSPSAAVTAGTLAALPFVYRTIKSFTESIDKDILNAASLDGAGKRQIFFTIQLPLARKGIVSGILLGALRASGEFGITMMIAGNIPGLTQTIPLAIWDSVMGGKLANAHLYAALLGLFSMSVIVIMRYFDGGQNEEAF